jgi:hypothetical protein
MKTESHDDGGPAFTFCIPDFHGDKPHLQEGMSLRDWFAGQALAGMSGDPERTGVFEDYAHDAYKFADAMLAARKS